jgi:guanyl-specific ribonuclease Sa
MYSSHCGQSKLLWISLRWLPSECSSSSTSAVASTNTANAAQLKVSTPPTRAMPSMPVNHSDLSGDQRTVPRRTSPALPGDGAIVRIPVGMVCMRVS